MVQWWCAAQGRPWEWTWQPYVGVWIVVALLALAYRPILGATRGEHAVSHLRKGSWAFGVLLLWAALDWPVGPLGASYLASVHMVQYLVVGLVTPVLLLLGVPPGAWSGLRDRLEDRPRLSGVLRDLTHPVTAAVLFNVGMTVTHWPGVVDALRVSQLGSFLMDAVWLLCGLVFWWPLVSPVPARPRFHPLLRIAYLAVNAIIITPPVAMLLYSRSPVYRVYELAPPVGDVSALWDQQFAGAIMKVGSGWIMGLGIAWIFVLWYRDRRERPEAVPGAPRHDTGPTT